MLHESLNRKRFLDQNHNNQKKQRVRKKTGIYIFLVGNMNLKQALSLLSRSSYL